MTACYKANILLSVQLFTLRMPFCSFFIEEIDRVKEMGQDGSLKVWRRKEKPGARLWNPSLGGLLKPVTRALGPAWAHSFPRKLKDKF